MLLKKKLTVPLRKEKMAMKVIVRRDRVRVLGPAPGPVQGGQKRHIRHPDLRPGPDHAARHRDLDVHGRVVVDLARAAEVEVAHQLPIEAVAAAVEVLLQIVAAAVAAEALHQIEVAVVVAAALLPSVLTADHDILLQGAEAVPDQHRNHKPVAPTPVNLAAAAIRNKYFRFSLCGHVSVLFDNLYLTSLRGYSPIPTQLLH